MQKTGSAISPRRGLGRARWLGAGLAVTVVALGAGLAITALPAYADVNVTGTAVLLEAMGGGFTWGSALLRW